MQTEIDTKVVFRTVLGMERVPIVGQMVTSSLVGLSGISRMVRVLLNGAMVGSIKAIL